MRSSRGTRVPGPRTWRRKFAALDVVGEDGAFHGGDGGLETEDTKKAAAAITIVTTDDSDADRVAASAGCV